MSRFKRIKNKTTKNSSVSIDEKITALNKELEKTGMLSERMTTSNVYSISQYVAPTDTVISPVPDGSGLVDGTWTQPVGTAFGGGAVDAVPTSFPKFWNNAGYRTPVSGIVNTDNLNGDGAALQIAKMPNNGEPFDSLPQAVRDAGAVGGFMKFNAGINAGWRSGYMAGGTRDSGGGSFNAYDDQTFGNKYPINHLGVDVNPTSHPHLFRAVQYWHPFSIFNPDIDARWPLGDQEPKYQGVVTEIDGVKYALFTAYKWIGDGGNKYISQHPKPASTILIQRRGIGDINYHGPITPGGMFGLSRQGYSYIDNRSRRSGRGAQKLRGGPTYRKAGSGGGGKISSISRQLTPYGRGGKVSSRGVGNYIRGKGVGFSPSAGRVAQNVPPNLPPKPTPAEIRNETVKQFRENGDNYAANKFYTEDRISELESKDNLTSTEQSELDQLKVNAVHLNQNAPPDPIPPRPRAEVEKDYTPAEVTKINNEINQVTSAEEQQETFASVSSELEKAVAEKKITPKEKNTLQMKIEASAKAGSDLPQEVTTVIANLGLPVLSLFDKRFESIRGAWNTLRGLMDNNDPLSPNFRSHDPTSENYKGPKEIKMSNGVRKQASDELNLALGSLNGGKGPRNPNGQLEADEITDVSEWMKNNQFKNEGTLAFYNSLHSLPPDTTTINLKNGKFSNLESNYWFTDPKDGDVYDTTGSPEAGWSTLFSNLITGVEKQARANKDLVGGNDYHERDKNAEGGRGDVIGKQFNTQMGFTSYDEYKPEGLSRIANGFLDAITGNKFDFDRRGGNDASKYPPPKQSSIFADEDGILTKYYTKSIFTGRDGKTYKSVLVLPYLGDSSDGSPMFGSLWSPGSYTTNIPLFDTPMDQPLGDYIPPDDLPDIPFTPPEEPDNRKDYEKNRDRQRRFRNSYEPKGDVLSEASKLGYFEPEELNVDIEKLRKGIMPEFPKKSPKIIDGYHQDSKLKPKEPSKDVYLKLDPKDLIRNHRLKQKEADEMMKTIDRINAHIEEHPEDLIHAQQRYPVDDPRLAELNWNMDQMLEAGEEYLDNNFKENQTLYKRATDRTKKNIKLTDPEYVQQRYDELRGTPKPKKTKLVGRLGKHLNKYESKSFFKHVNSKNFKKINEQKIERQEQVKQLRKEIEIEFQEKKNDWRKDLGNNTY